MGNLGPQFTTLYRGIMDPNDDGASLSMRTRSLGQHWSTDKSMAEHFASFDEDGNETPGLVLTAKVHARHIVQPGTPEHRRMQNDLGVHGGNSLERELPVRKGGIVHVQSVERISTEDNPASNWRTSDISSVFGPRKTGRA